MRRRAAPIGLAAALLAIAIAAASISLAAASVRSPAQRHRLHRAPPALPSKLSVDEQEWSVIPSEKVVAAGTVRITAYDRGQDGHDLTIQGPGGLHGPIRGQVMMMSGGSATLTVHLVRGTYVLYCSMFMGTSQSHYAKGMHATISVR